MLVTVVFQCSMCFDITVVVLFVCLSTVNFSWSWKAREDHFLKVKSDNGEDLCATSPPNMTLHKVKSRIQCSSTCSQGCPSPCHAFNYWKNAQLCQQFYYRPSTYAIQQDCVSYQVTSIGALKQYSETIGFSQRRFW